ncbi:MAG: AAA family ATPase [Bacillota bacterium]
MKSLSDKVVRPGVFLITGVMASGKSTVAQLLAERFERGVHVRGDIFRRMIVSGREEMLPTPSQEAERQLLLRHRLTAAVADTYHASGFTVVAQDIIIGPLLTEVIHMIRSRPLYVVVLCPSIERIAQREADRQKKGYGVWSIEELDRQLRLETERVGLWLDTSDQTPQQTVETILSRAPVEAQIVERQS